MNYHKTLAFSPGQLLMYLSSPVKSKWWSRSSLCSKQPSSSVFWAKISATKWDGRSYLILIGDTNLSSSPFSIFHFTLLLFMKLVNSSFSCNSLNLRISIARRPEIFFYTFFRKFLESAYRISSIFFFERGPGDLLDFLVDWILGGEFWSS